MRECTCPSCGAELILEDGNRDFAFCQYCGNKIILDDFRSTQRIIDEAKIKQAETDRIVRLKEMEIANSNNNWRKIAIIVWVIVSAIMLIISFVLIGAGNDNDGITGMLLLYATIGVAIGGGTLIFKVIPNKAQEKIALQNGGIRFPKSLVQFHDMDYISVQSTLVGVGFTNLTCVNMHDLTLGLLQKPGKVDSISVSGENINVVGKVYMPDVPIVISYHGK